MPAHDPAPASIQPRMPGSDLHQLVSSYLAARDEPDDPWLSGRARRQLDQATRGYALGMPLATVRADARRALLTFREVQRNRPSRAALTTAVGGVKVDGSTACGAAALRYLYWALLLRQDDLATGIAVDIWDPEPPHQSAMPLNRVAHALRDTLLGGEGLVPEHLARLRRSAPKHDHQQAAAVAAIARGDGRQAAAAIRDLAGWHRRAKGNEYLATEKALCRSTSGLAALALDRGLLAAGDVPRDLQPLAVELVLPA